MDIVRFKGGLGNQLFQYAFMRSLEETGRNVGASLSYYTENKSVCMPFILDKVFPQSKMKVGYDQEFFVGLDLWREAKRNSVYLDRYLNDYKNRTFWNESSDEAGKYQSNIYKTTNCVFVGYWQSYKYFDEIENVLRKELQFDVRDNKLKGFISQIDPNNSVSIHIRRGDYIKYSDLYGNICTTEYYQNAIKTIKQKVQTPFFYVLSDDIDWCKQNLLIDNAVYISSVMFNNYSDWYDMCVMSKCSHNIIANSSFSWWGAWLNLNRNKIVIAPQKWINGYDYTEICPESWVRI